MTEREPEPGAETRTAPPRRPGDDRRVRGLERRRGGRQHRAGAPRAELGRRAAGLDRPRGVLRLPGHAARTCGSPTASPAASSGRPRGCRWRSCRAPSGTSCSSTASSRTCAGARSARELLGYVERLGVTKVITLGALLTDTPHTRPTPVSGTSYDAASARELRVEPTTLPGPHGHRRGLPERLRRGRHPGDLVLGVGAALRVAGPGAEGRGRAAAPRRGGARRRGAAGRAARAGRGVGAHRLRDGRGRRRGARVRPPAGGAGRGRRRRRPARRPTATRSPPTSSATCAAAAPGARAAERRPAPPQLPRPHTRSPGPASTPARSSGRSAAASPWRCCRSWARRSACPPARRRSRSRPTLLPFAALHAGVGHARRALGPAADRRRRLRRVRRRRRWPCVLAPTLPLFLGGAGAAGRRERVHHPAAARRAGEHRARRTRLGRALGWFGSMQAAGQTSAPLVGGLAAEVDWRMAFVGCGRVVGRAAGGRRHPRGGGTSAGRAAAPAHGVAARRCCASAWSRRWAGAASPG